jgi:hypothetical protein
MKENAGDFTLSSEASAKLGLTAETEGAETSKEEKATPKVATGEEIPSEVTGEETPEKGTQVANSKKPSKEEKAEDKGQKQEKEKPVKPASEENPFHTKVLANLSRFDNEELQGKFLKDLENYEKFMATNTQESMRVSDERKAIEALAKKLGSNDISEAVKVVSELEDLQDFLTSSDDWYDGKEQNPIRKLVETLTASLKGNQEHAQELSVLDKEKANLALKQELLDLYEIDPNYKDEKILDEVVRLADENGVNLATAHKIRLGVQAQAQVEQFNSQINSLNEKIKNLEKELKAKTKEASEKENSFKPGLTGDKGGPRNFNPSKATGLPDWDKSRARVMAKFGID